MNPYKIRSQLLMDATDYTGTLNPRQTAVTWAQGLKLRNATMQYAVMAKQIKVLYEKQLSVSTEKGNWVTGTSSPWIDSFTILYEDKINASEAEIAINFNTYTSAGPVGTYQAIINIKKELFWRINRIRMDKELYPYAGFISDSVK